jgi:hypothetical protein
MPNDYLRHGDYEYRREMRQRKEWPKDMHFANDPDPGDTGITRLDAHESLTKESSTAWSCIQSPLAGII